MLLSQIFAWISVFLCLMEVMRFFARVSNHPGPNRFFHKCHILLGILLLVTGIAHGFLAGNPASISLAKAELGTVFFTINLGTACFFCAVLLGCTYLLRKKFRSSWLLLHRLFTVAMIAFLVFHLLDVGISLPKSLFGSQEPQVTAFSALAKEVPTIPSPGTSLFPLPTSEPVESTSTVTPSSTETVQPEMSPDSLLKTPESLETPSGSELSDGVYEGSAAGRNGIITVQVTVESGAISHIEVLSHSETPKYYTRAEEVIQFILAAGSSDVDSITGATLTSEGIKAAVANALEP